MCLGAFLSIFPFLPSVSLTSPISTESRGLETSTTQSPKNLASFQPATCNLSDDKGKDFHTKMGCTLQLSSKTLDYTLNSCRHAQVFGLQTTSMAMVLKGSQLTTSSRTIHPNRITAIMTRDHGFYKRSRRRNINTFIILNTIITRIGIRIRIIVLIIILIIRILIIVYTYIYIYIYNTICLCSSAPRHLICSAARRARAQSVSCPP